MRTGVAALIVLVVVALVPSAAAAQLPVGEADGVRIVRERGAIVVVFTQRAERLWRRVAGLVVSVHCWERGEPDENDFFSVSGGGSSLRAPKRGRRLRTGDGTRGMDYCRVWRAPRRVRRGRERMRLGRRLIVSIPLTQKGAVYLDEQSKARRLQRLLLVASLFGGTSDGFLTPSQLLDRIERAGGRGSGLVALPSPDATPSGGDIGYYSDGRERAAAVIVSRSGRRLFIEYQPDGVLRTNVAPYIYGKLD